MRTFRTALAAAAAVAITVAGLTIPATGQLQQSAVASDDPAGWTPHLARANNGPQPRTHTYAQLGNTMYVGGRFSLVQDARRNTTLPRSNIFAFNANNGDISSFAPDVDGMVWSLLAAGDSLYVGGSFKNVNGERHVALVKLDAATGQVDPTFRPRLRWRVSQIALVNGRLIVGGTFPGKLRALDPDTGRTTSYINLDITGQVPLSTTKTEVFRFAVNPAGTRLVAVGNFTGVDGQERVRIFMVDLGATSATLDPWWYPPFARKCTSNTPARQAYVEDVDFSPDGSYFVLAATGNVPPTPADIGTMVCDGAARFETDIAAPVKPTWINYTGGDSLHAIAATGAAVYVSGHSRWLDNPFGRDSAGPGAVDRMGGGAIDPVTGKALAWNPNMPARIGGYVLYARPAGLWIGSDSRRIHREYHRGIAFMPLP